MVCEIPVNRLGEKREMGSKGQTSSEAGFSYFEIQAHWGVTKHMGGLRATDRLAELCHIGQDKHILEIGSGVGVSTCHLARKYGCHVLGIDLSEKMVAWAGKRARRRGLAERVEFKIADAQSLPFEEARFDAVISESVTAFPADKGRAVSEYVRVTRPGGYVGLSEGTWLKPPPPELVGYIERTMSGARFLSPEGWRELLEGSGLTEITVSTYAINALRQRLDEMSGLDFADYLDRLRAIGSFLSLAVKSAAFRRYAREIMPSMRDIKNLFGYLGYGLYVGRK